MSDNTDRIMNDLEILLMTWNPPSLFEQIDAWWADFDKKWASIDSKGL